MKLLVASPWIKPSVEELKSEFPSVEFITAESKEGAVAAAADVEVAFGFPSREAFLAAKRLRWIQSGSAGVEGMRSIPELAESDVIVTNTRGAHAVTIAEHAFGMLVFLARNFHSLLKSQEKKEWQRPLEQPGVGLAGLTIGIIGLGQIGRAIGKRAQAFEMKIIAVDAHDVPRPDYVAEFWLLDGLPELLQRADVAVVATPITDETRGMLGPEQLTLMKPSAYLLVMSRGGIIDEPTLAAMLREGRLAGAGLDVTAIEPLPPESELWEAPNIIITPHCSPSSQLTRANVTAIMRENLTRYLAGEPLTNLVDKKLGY